MRKRHHRTGSHWVPCESARRGITGVRARIHTRSAAVRITGLVAKLQQKTLVAVVATILSEVTQNDVAVIAFVLQAGLLEVEEKSVRDLRDGIHRAPFVAVGAPEHPAATDFLYFCSSSRQLLVQILSRPCCE
jgi:hypothetical protein